MNKSVFIQQGGILLVPDTRGSVTTISVNMMAASWRDFDIDDKYTLFCQNFRQSLCLAQSKHPK
ncbi:MAG: hypothetical protein IPO98_14690 [Saprospiraceae bacterium]|nr:hypothetical protein [Saprospiraceae bacterium]